MQETKLFSRFPIIGNFLKYFFQLERSGKGLLYSTATKWQSLESSKVILSKGWKLFLAVFLLGSLAGCMTKQTIKTDEFSIKERTRTTMCLGFIPIYQSDISKTSEPAR